MHSVDLIIKKRNGGVLTREEIDQFVSGYVKGEIPDYQVAALLMAIWFRKMNSRERADLTFAMRDSGDVIDLSSIPGPIVDKHSTGGVADTTTLIVAPIVAACGLRVAKMSGRGLGHTGGTLDKLESIPGLSIHIEMNRFREIVTDCGLSVIGQTAELVPADKLLYALRDTTGTIDDVSLIAASIMSKKLASGSDCIVLDVKVGNGAFMANQAEGEELAKAMVEIGGLAGKKVQAVVTDMNQPLGNAVGNSLEVREAIEVLNGQCEGDLRTVSLALASRLLLIGDKAKDEEDAHEQAERALSSGAAMNRLKDMIRAQGGDPAVCDTPDLLPKAKNEISIVAEKSGYICEMNTGELGMTALLLGAGRATKEDIIDLSVGFLLKKRRGDFVEQGDELALFHVNDQKNLQEAKARFLQAMVLGEQPPAPLPLIYSTIS